MKKSRYELIGRLGAILTVASALGMFVVMALATVQLLTSDWLEIIGGLCGLGITFGIGCLAYGCSE